MEEDDDDDDDDDDIWLKTSMELSPSWQANSSSPRQEIPCILRNTNVHYRIHNSHSCVPILNQICSVPTLTSYLKMHLNVIVPSEIMSSKWSLFLGLRHQKSLLASPIPPTLQILRPSRFFFIWFGWWSWRAGGLQIWRVSANILKEAQGGPAAWGWARGWELLILKTKYVGDSNENLKY
jgi:hypothetical protein